MRGLLNTNIALFDSINKFSFPEVFPFYDRVDCDKWIDFDRARTYTGQERGLHFFVDDYKFNCIWENPKRYINFLSKFDYVIMPDFSLYYDFPVALQIYNKYRNHWLAAFYYIHGVNIIPYISLSTPECWEWSVLGYPKNSVVSFSDIGAVRDKWSRDITLSAYDYMFKCLSPSQVLYFTRSASFAPSEATVVQLPFLRG